LAKKFTEQLGQAVWIEGLTLPQDQHLPARFSQSRFDTLVPGHIGGEFSVPKSGTGFGRRRSRTAFVSVPEASVNENDRAQPREYKIRAAGQISPVKSIAESERVGRSADSEFGA